MNLFNSTRRCHKTAWFFKGQKCVTFGVSFLICFLFWSNFEFFLLDSTWKCFSIRFTSLAGFYFQTSCCVHNELYQSPYISCQKVLCPHLPQVNRVNMLQSYHEALKEAFYLLSQLFGMYVSFEQLSSITKLNIT